MRAKFLLLCVGGAASGAQREPRIAPSNTPQQARTPSLQESLAKKLKQAKGVTDTSRTKVLDGPHFGQRLVLARQQKTSFANSAASRHTIERCTQDAYGIGLLSAPRPSKTSRFVTNSVQLILGSLLLSRRSCHNTDVHQWL